MRGSNTDYQARRQARRAKVKADLLPIIQRAEARNEQIDFRALAREWQCGGSTLRQMRRELAEAGLCGFGSNYAEPVPPDLAARVAKVREAKRAKRKRSRKTFLTDAELDEVLP